MTCKGLPRRKRAFIANSWSCRLPDILSQETRSNESNLAVQDIDGFAMTPL